MKTIAVIAFCLFSIAAFAQSAVQSPAPIAGLPPGITFDPVLHQFSGTPSPGADGVYAVTVTLCDSEQPQPACVSQPYQLTVYGKLVIVATSLPSAVVGAPYLFQPGATGGLPPYTWSAK